MSLRQIWAHLKTSCVVPIVTPITCPEWEYADLPGYDAVLKERTRGSLEVIRRSSPRRLADNIKDTRTVHGQYFDGLTPPSTPYYAGNYRGQDFLCLRNASVRILADPKVGHPPEAVIQNMAVLAGDITHALAECDVAWKVPNAVVSEIEKLTKVVSVATAIFVYFLEIHPYINGNGHAARFILIATLARHGIFLRRWAMHPRPADPPYGAAIRQYRSGDRGPLERFVLSCL